MVIHNAMWNGSMLRHTTLAPSICRPRNRRKMYTIDFQNCFSTPDYNSTLQIINMEGRECGQAIKIFDNVPLARYNTSCQLPSNR